MIFSIINEEKGADLDEFQNMGQISYFKYNVNLNELNQSVSRMNNFQINNKYEKQISELNDKIKELEKTINDNKMGCWYFDDHSIKITIGYLDEINMFEIDKDSLELVGHNDSIFMFSEDTNSYFAKIENEDSDISRNDFKIGMYPCYSLDDLIEKGKLLINNKEMSESKKMRYGLE